MGSISVVRVMLAAVALVAASFALAGTSSASHVEARIVVPSQIQVGQPAAVQVTLSSVDQGVSVSHVPVVFYINASFGGVTGEVELGRAVTDENGVAIVTYEPRSASVHEIRIEYVLPGESEPETITTSVFVTDAGTQLYRSTAGVDIPGLNVWLLIALLSAVWAILLFGIAMRVVAIAGAGDDGGSPLSSGAGG